MDEAPLHGPVPLPVAARDLRELSLLPNALLVLSAAATAPGLLARQRPRVFPVSAVRATNLRRGFDAGLPAGPRATRPVALAARAARDVEIHRCSRAGRARRCTGVCRGVRHGRLWKKKFSARPKSRVLPTSRVHWRPAVRAASASGHSSRAGNRSNGRAREGEGNQPQHGRRRHVARCAPVARSPAPFPPLAPPPPPPRDDGRHPSLGRARTPLR